MRDGRTTSTVEVDGRYATQAVESGVADLSGSTVGHVGLFDLDETSLDAALDVAERLPGPVAVLRSSSRSWHLWALSVRPLDEWLGRADEVDSEALDPSHAALSESRGCMVLRTDAKVRLSDGETAAPEPTLQRFVDDDLDDRPLSRPHLELLDDEQDLDRERLVDVEVVGESLDRRAYLADLHGGSA